MQNNYCKVLSGFALLLSYIALADNACCVSHQFVPRSITTDLAYTNMLNYYERHHNDKNKFIWSGNFIYQQSRKSDKLGSTLLLNNDCNCISVSQNSLGLSPPTDVNSLWLGLANNNPANPFAAEFCVSPQRRAFAYYNYMYADLSNWVCGLWADLSFAVLSVAHRLNCCEKGNNSSICAGLTTVAQALENPIYEFGKFDCGNGCKDSHRAGVDDIQVRVGYERNWCNDQYLWGVYAIGTIPTGRRQTNEFVFEPVVGSRHGSIGVGLNGEYQLWCNNGRDDHQLSVLVDANYRYAFKRHECRSFDLCKNGAFSRYMLVANSANPGTPMPAINYLSQEVEVTPRSTVQAWLALHYERCNYNFEAGYNLFWRQQEQIGCFDCFPVNVGIYQLSCTAAPGCTTASTAVISQGPSQVTTDATFVAIKAEDLNRASGAADKALSNKLYGIVSRNGCACDCMDWHVGLGGSYEFVSGDFNCSTFSQWAVFGQFSLLF